MADSWTGIREFERYMAKARADTAAEAMRACNISADELVEKVRKAVPPGDPRNGHIRDSVTKTKTDENTFTVKIGGEAQPYAAALEFGHGNADGSRTPAQKIFFPNVKRQNKTHGRRIRRWFRKALKDSGAV